MFSIFHRKLQREDGIMTWHILTILYKQRFKIKNERTRLYKLQIILYSSLNLNQLPVLGTYASKPKTKRGERKRERVSAISRGGRSNIITFNTAVHILSRSIKWTNRSIFEVASYLLHWLLIANVRRAYPARTAGRENVSAVCLLYASMNGNKERDCRQYLCWLRTLPPQSSIIWWSWTTVYIAPCQVQDDQLPVNDAITATSTCLFLSGRGTASQVSLSSRLISIWPSTVHWALRFTINSGGGSGVLWWACLFVYYFVGIAPGPHIEHLPIFSLIHSFIYCKKHTTNMYARLRGSSGK